MELCLKHQYISCYLLQFAFMTCKDISKDFQLNNETYHSKWTTKHNMYICLLKKKGERKTNFCRQPKYKTNIIGNFYVFVYWKTDAFRCHFYDYYPVRVYIYFLYYYFIRFSLTEITENMKMTIDGTTLWICESKKG